MIQPQLPQTAKSSDSAAPGTQIPDRMYFRIGDVSDLVGVKPYVLRYWESEFPMITPEKSSTGQRVFRRADVEGFLLIKHLLYKERYSIEGARKRLRELKREGQLGAFKRETVHGGEDQVERKQRMERLRDSARELQTLARIPIQELFKL